MLDGPPSVGDPYKVPVFNDASGCIVEGFNTVTNRFIPYRAPGDFEVTKRMARLRCDGCQAVIAEGVPEIQARHVARSVCRTCQNSPTGSQARAVGS